MRVFTFWRVTTRRTLVPLLVVAAALLTGCIMRSEAPKAVAQPIVVPLSQTMSINQDSLNVRFVPGPPIFTVDGEQFIVDLKRSVDGMLGGSAYFYRNFGGYKRDKRLDNLHGVFVFAVTSSGVKTVVANPLVGQKISSQRLMMAGGTLMIYSRIPSDTIAIRLASTAQPGSLKNPRTLWLEAPLDKIPVRPVDRPLGSTF